MSEIKIERKNNFRIEYTKGDTYALKLTFNNISQDLTSAFFTVKENTEDETPLIEKTIGSGISKLDENLYRDQIVYKLQLQAEDSRNLQADHLYLYDLKIAVGNVIKTVIKGNFVVSYNVTGTDRITTELAEIEVDDVIETDAETTPATEGIEYEQDPVAMAKIGDITDLETTAKNTLVDAINETNTKASASLEEIQKIEDGTVTVPSATHAVNSTHAEYASADHSKGTIEERLTNLGFRQGSIALDVGSDVTLNELKRQGNYVVGNLEMSVGFSQAYSPIVVKIGSIPNNFVPKEQLDIETYIVGMAQNYPVTITLYPAGDIYIRSEEFSIVTGTLKINFGYEANPIG